MTIPVVYNCQHNDATAQCILENGVGQHDHRGQRLIAAALDTVLHFQES